MANYSFNEDITIGEDGEDVVINDLKDLGISLINKNKDNRYDINMMDANGNEVKYEIKTDVFCRPENDTGNIFVEYQCRGKFSGILVTQAKWFVTYFKYLREIWYIQTDVLKKIIVENDIQKVEFSGDSGSNTKGWLLPKYQYKKHFIVRKVPKSVE